MNKSICIDEWLFQKIFFFIRNDTPRSEKCFWNSTIIRRRKTSIAYIMSLRPRYWLVVDIGRSKKCLSKCLTVIFRYLFVFFSYYSSYILLFLIFSSSSSVSGSSADLYTQVLFNYYSPPDGFCFDIVCGVNPIVDDEHSPEYNVEAKVKVWKIKRKK